MYMAVTSDIFELPLVVADTAGELAIKMGVTTNLIYSEISKENKNKRKQSGKNRGYKFVKVEVGE